MSAISGQNLGLALGEYLEQELVPKANGLQKVILYMTIPVVTAQAQTILDKYKPALSILDSLTENDMVDLDKLYPRLKDAVHKSGKVTIMGIIFDETDVDKINAIAQKYTMEQ